MSLPKADLVLVVLSPGVAVGASGWGIDSQGHVHKIPSNNPEAFHLASAAVSLLDQSGSVQDEKLRAQMNDVGTKLLQSAAKNFAPQAVHTAG